MKRIIFTFSVVCLSFSLGICQTTEDKAQKSIKDPKIKENEAKADVFVQPRIIMPDQISAPSVHKQEKLMRRRNAMRHRRLRRNFHRQHRLIR